MEKLFLQGMSISEFELIVQNAVKKFIVSPVQINSVQSKSGNNSELYSRQEVANLLKISLPTLHDWTKQGILQSYRIGGRVLYKSEDIENALTKVKNLKYKRG